ncbi:MAG: hypothetical protein AAFX76_14035 [Planctomycetota bacterium]
MSRPRSTNPDIDPSADTPPRVVRPEVPSKLTPPPMALTSQDDTIDEDVYDAVTGRLRRLRLVRGWLFVLALLLGVGWGAASAHFDVRWSWPIVPIGAWFGLMWNRVGRGSAGRAVGLTVGVYVVSVVAAAGVSRYAPSQRMIQQQPSVLQAAVHLWMQEHGELPEIAGVGRIGDDAAGDLGDEIVTAFDIEQLVRVEIEGLSPSMQRTILSWYYDQAGGRAGVDRGPGWGGRFAALLWLATAVWLAWRLAQRRDEIDLDEDSVQL